MTIYPRVLIVGQVFDNMTGGGITLSNLFQGWPKDRLAVVGNIDRPPNLSVCERYYGLGSLEWKLVWPGKYFQRHQRSSGALKIPARSAEHDALMSDFAQLGRSRKDDGRVWKASHALLELVGAEQLLRRLHLSGELMDWIRAFQPDLVYTQLSTLNLIRLVNQIKRASEVPLVIHMMDDWPTTSYTHGILSPYLHWRMNEELTPLMNSASALMGISSKMCQAFEPRYGRRFLAFHNPIDAQTWLQSAKMSWKSGSTFRLMYTGRIGRANQESLSDICDVVAELHSRGWSIRLDLYTMEHNSDTGKLYLRNGCVFVNPPIPYSSVPPSLARADALVLPLDFGTDSIRFARYSMPTKTPEYMISGTPTLVYTPPDIAVSEYARDGQWGYVVSERNKGALERAIIDLMQHQNLREQLGRRAQVVAMRNHDAMQVRESFRQALADAANRWSSAKSSMG